jgi:hypothetical protein
MTVVALSVRNGQAKNGTPFPVSNRGGGFVCVLTAMREKKADLEERG